MAFAFAFNAFESAGLIVWITTKQRLVPGRLLGRVSSFDWFVSIGLVPASYALTGPVAEAFGARTTLIAAGLVGGLVTISFLLLPGLRRVERGPELALASTTEPVAAEPALARPIPVDQELVGSHQQTLANLREAIERWRASRARLVDEIDALQREEQVLDREIELAQARLVDVRTRLAVLRGLRDHYDLAGSGAAADGSLADLPLEADAV
jgi:hypothetical protein